MSSRFCIAAVVCALFACLLATGAGTQVILGFSESYSAGGESRAHRGIDVAAAAGSSVAALRGGRVAFVGRVPAAGGGTMLAVSIDTADGRLSFMPLSETMVEQGESIAAGAVLGRLASSGDPSSEIPHLHVGLRREGLYVDPSTLLAPAPAAATAPAEPAPAPAPSPDASARGSAVPSDVSASQPHVVDAGQLGRVGSPALQVACAVPAGGTSVAVGRHGVEPVMGAGVSLAPTGLGAGEHEPAGTVAGVLSHDGSSGAGLRVPRIKLLGRPLIMQSGPALASSLALLAAVIAVTVAVFGRRWTARQAIQPKVSTRFGTLLQHLRAGDTLCGLTSCSGPTAFTVPGPSAQRR